MYRKANGAAASAVRQGGGRHMEYMALGRLMNIYSQGMALLLATVSPLVRLVCDRYAR